MPIVIKEIRVNTVVEKKVITHQEISEEIYRLNGDYPWQHKANYPKTIIER